MPFWKINEESVYYCKECNQIYNQCYELQGEIMCSRCWSDQITILNEKEIQPFLRKKRLQKLNSIAKD